MTLKERILYLKNQGVSISLIAKLAGIHRQTLSDYANKKDYKISLVTEKKIRDIVKKFDFI